MSEVKTGVKHSEETKRKLSKINKGKKLSEETKEKMKKNNGKYWRWKKHTEETKKKISEANKGKKNPQWKGGVTSNNRRIKNSKEYKLWRKACLERDNFTCQKTGQLGGKLNVHHINNFAEFPELRLAIDNGITLSEEAHKVFHKIYGKKNNTKEQLMQFLAHHYEPKWTKNCNWK